MLKLFNRSENTWEPEDNLDCPDLITEYENRVKNKSKRKSEVESDNKKKKKPDASSSTTNENVVPSIDDNPQRGFDRGLVPEKIIGATDSSGELMFLMKWKNSDEADLVLAKTANQKCPQIVIQFYEERLTWHTGGDDKDENTKQIDLESK
jgi:chromobox protein 1